MDNLPPFLSNATPLVSRFFGEMSNKRQFESKVVNLEQSLDFGKIMPE
jgi:hypothetical protein